jgi:hypothetical protein
METTLVGYTPYEAVVQEMSSDGSDQLVPVNAELLQRVSEDDTAPVFVTIEVLNEGTSRNKRRWTKEHLQNVCEQINRKHPDGYRGHISIQERSTKAPEAETIWLGAVVKEVDGKARLIAKGYVLPYATKLRQYLKSAKAAGKNVAVSVYGTAAQAAKDAAGYILPNGFNLESIDWARPGSEGVVNSGLFQVTAEMTDGSTKHKEDIVDREQTIKSAKKSELEELNPTVISEITDEATQGKEAELQTVVAEMDEVTNALGLDDDSDKKPAEVIAEMRSQLNEERLENQLRSKVKNAEARKSIKHLVVAEMNDGKGVDEAMTAALESPEGKNIIAEMLDAPPVVNPRIDRPGQIAQRRFTKTVKK